MDVWKMEARLQQIRDLKDLGIIKLDFEKILERHYRRWLKSGDSIIDVGAHVGRHLSVLLDIVGEGGQAMAFEPLPFAYEKLSERFSGPNLLMHNTALSNREGETDFTYAQGSPEESGIRQRVFNFPSLASPAQIKVKVDRLDNFTINLKAVDYIKIDIEGGEIDCLVGGVNTLSRFRPLVSVEYGSLSFKAYGHSVDSLFLFAKENKYVIYDIFLNSLSDINCWRKAVDFVSWDFLLVPEEKIHDFESRVMSGGGEDASVEDQFKALKDVVDCLSAEIQSMKSSRSWKITAPLRMAKSWFSLK